VPTREAPDWVFRLLAIFSSTVRPALPHLGVVRSATNEKARRVLGWSPRSSEDAVAATGESLIKFGLVKAG
jgi:dihydroflavonol-4-reductase